MRQCLQYARRRNVDLTHGTIWSESGLGRHRSGRFTFYVRKESRTGRKKLLVIEFHYACDISRRRTGLSSSLIGLLVIGHPLSVDLRDHKLRPMGGEKEYQNMADDEPNDETYQVLWTCIKFKFLQQRM